MDPLRKHGKWPRMKTKSEEPTPKCASRTRRGKISSK
uniref:Uncharacterized protein n=1 Tax=Arundo donax TaxID=35708 RepID=A0A0A9H4M1_ARUDO